MRAKLYFPYRLFRWFLLRQIVTLAILYILLGTGLWISLKDTASESTARDIGLEMLVWSLTLGFACAVLVSVFTARRLLVPLGRLIEKTRRTRESPLLEELPASEEEELMMDGPGEWFELEKALSRLGRDLRVKTISLSREKTELRAIMSAVSEAVLAISKERKIQFYNPQFAYLFDMHLANSDVRLGEILRTPEVLEAYSQALAGTTIRKEIEISLQEERLPRHFQLSIAPLKKKHNLEIYGAVGIFHDITELKRAERIRIEFVGNVSHELRTPVTTINGYVQTVMQDLEKGRTDQIEEFLRIVSQNVSRLKNLVEDLLDLSALESGQELKIERLDVREITETVLSQVNGSQHKVHLKYDFDEIMADGKRLEQVVRNLMENAVRYVPPGRNIEIRWQLDPDGNRVLSIKDDGNGIAPQHLARLFERFYRVDEGRSRTEGGTGIGLSLVKHIMQRHGGQVRVQSELGAGAEFICEFPIGE
jgi:two-component system phosphate regulon sensor histidine kinase PhoR